MLPSMRGQDILTGVVILIVCGALAGADFVLSEQPRMVAVQDETDIQIPETPAVTSSSSSSASSVTASDASSSAATGVVKKGTSTKKASGINVAEVLAKLYLIMQPTNEASFVLVTSPDRSKVQTSVLLRNNDRAFLISWMESDDVKTVFASLKQALQEQFSGKVTDLVDEIRTPTNGPPVDYLSFIDPALSSERIVFLRNRTRLYELHVAKNGEDLLEQLVAALSM